MATKIRTIRLDDEDWEALATLAREVIPTGRKPSYATYRSDWQVTELLRSLARGRIAINGYRATTLAPTATPKRGRYG